MKKWIWSLMVLSMFLGLPDILPANEGKKTFLVHMQSSLKKDDAKICVAYNVIWAALREGYQAKDLVDADAVTTFKIGWKG